MKKKYFLSFYILLFSLYISGLSISINDVKQAQHSFPDYVKMLKKQAEWFDGGASFIVKKAARALGYDKYTIELIRSIVFYFKYFGYSKNGLENFIRDNQDEIVAYANMIFKQVGSGKIKASKFVRIEHKGHVDRLTFLSDQERYRATEDPKYFFQLVKNGRIDKDIFFFNVTLNLFTEYIGHKNKLIKQVVPKWLQWLF